jgi:hypothetical protein
LKVEFGGADIVVEGTVDGTDRVLTGTLTQAGHSTTFTLERAKPEALMASDADIEAQKDYSHTGPNDLPGHWQGILDVKESGQKIRLAFNIAKMPDGKFVCSMGSPDQAQGIPASTIEYAPPNLRLEWPAIGGSYNGKLENGKLSGVWRQGGGAFPFVLERNGAN